MAFLGESADDTVTYLDVAEAVLKFLDLHIVQYGMDFFRFKSKSKSDEGFLFAFIVSKLRNWMRVNDWELR